MLDILNEMAISRSDAIDRCISLGKKFIEHFDKIYKNQNDIENIHHWTGEMIGWYNDVKKLRLKPNNKNILDGQLRDWFFTAGALPEDFIESPTDSELDLYDRFCTSLLYSNDLRKSVKDVLGIEF